MGANERRVRVLHVLVGYFQLSRLIASQVVHHAVGTLGQTTHDFLALGLFEVEGEAAFALIQRLKKLTVVFTQQVRRDVT